MINGVIFAILSSINIHDTYSIYRENIIDSNCIFDIIRIQKKDIICNDYGLNKKYCDHYSIPEEFRINKEVGINNKNSYNIKPTIMYKQILDNRIILADFYFTFKCNKLASNLDSYFLNISR